MPTEIIIDNTDYFGLWMQFGAIVISAIGIIGTLIVSRGISKKRATLDIILAEESDPRLVKQRTEFVKLREAGDIIKFAAHDQTSSEGAALIRAVLNFNELIAIGIVEKTVDKALYKRWGRTKFIKDWIGCRPFVMQLRLDTKVPTYFCEIEKLAKKWATKDEKPHV